VRVFNS